MRRGSLPNRCCSCSLRHGDDGDTQGFLRRGAQRASAQGYGRRGRGDYEFARHHLRHPCRGRGRMEKMVGGRCGAGSVGGSWRGWKRGVMTCCCGGGDGG